MLASSCCQGGMRREWAWNDDNVRPNSLIFQSKGSERPTGTALSTWPAAGWLRPLSDQKILSFPPACVSGVSELQFGLCGVSHGIAAVLPSGGGGGGVGRDGEKAAKAILSKISRGLCQGQNSVSHG